MIRFWIFTLYVHWRILNKMSFYIQEGVFRVLMFLFPVLKKKQKSIRNTFRPSAIDKRSGTDLGLTFKIATTQWVIIYGIAGVIIFNLLGIVIGKFLIVWGIVLVGFAYLTCEYLIWKNDRYLLYFEAFKKQELTSGDYTRVFLFDLAFMLGIYFMIKIYG